MAPVEPEKGGHFLLPLQAGNHHVEIHPINALQFENHMFLEDIGNRLWHFHGGLRLLVTWPRRGHTTAWRS